MFLHHDPYDEFASGYLGMGYDPANLTDPTGGCTTCWAAVQSAIENFSTLQNVTVFGKAKTLTTAGKISQSFIDASQSLLSFASNLAWNMAGFSAAFGDSGPC
jgi:hypothetical protein